MLPWNEWLWAHEFWLPPGFTWEDMKETEEIRYPQPRHLLLSIPLALLLVAIRFIFERKVAIPLSRKMGLREEVRRKAAPNPILEAFYATCRRGPKEEELSGLAKRCDLQPRQVERWFRYRRNEDRPSLTKKFCEASWFGAFDLISFCVGLAVLYDKPWFWDPQECWVGYPQQPLQPSIFAYYILKLSYFWSMVFTLPSDIKWKDFYQEIIHHTSTLFLTSFSYCANYVRIGTLVMFIHDASDCFMQPAKIFNYVKWQKTCNCLFLAFSAVFLFTRLVIFPYKILYNTYYYTMELFQPVFGYYFMNALLMILQVLHIFWSSLIVCMIYRLMRFGRVRKDLRSDTDETEIWSIH
ncbi:ceramide synthase 4-like [Elgaria multicarinata webbii]|uniref:ceramide synthase 4-like n=1 Tax=Elgaria multicarinata webbii TaxID=159646 RepID=UPI002FCCF655